MEASKASVLYIYIDLELGETTGMVNNFSI